MPHCPVHHWYGSDVVRDGYLENCPRCDEKGMKVARCELDKRERVVSTLEQEGYCLDHWASYVTLVFRLKRKS